MNTLGYKMEAMEFQAMLIVYTRKYGYNAELLKELTETMK